MFSFPNPFNANSPLPSSPPLNSSYCCLQVNAAYISEYSRDSEISRGRSRFFHGQKDIMLYSGRAHFFRYMNQTKRQKRYNALNRHSFFLFMLALFDNIFIFFVLNLTFLLLFFFCCRRYQIRGAKHIIFYSLPEYALFYAEYVNMLTRDASAAAAGEDEGDEGAAGRYNNTSGSGSGGSGDLGMESVSCLVLFTPYERMALERIVGPKRCAHMLNASQSTFMFC
jgi:hypothetical protein